MTLAVGLPCIEQNIRDRLTHTFRQNHPSGSTGLDARFPRRNHDARNLFGGGGSSEPVARDVYPRQALAFRFVRVLRAKHLQFHATRITGSKPDHGKSMSRTSNCHPKTHLHDRARERPRPSDVRARNLPGASTAHAPLTGTADSDFQMAGFCLKGSMKSVIISRGIMTETLPCGEKTKTPDPPRNITL